jgi:hypothetical protein
MSLIYHEITLDSLQEREPGRRLIDQGLSKMNEERLWKRGISLCGSCIRGTWREGSFTGDKALEMDVCFHRGPVLGNMGGRFFPRACERR